MTASRSSNRRGTVLIVVMVVVFVVAAMVLALGKQVRTEALVSGNELSKEKADAAERGAEQFVLSVLSDYRDQLPDLTEENFTAVPVGDAYFWVVRPTYNDESAPAWGLVDESSKLDLNTASQEQIAAVPGMTDDLASAIVAWRGAGVAAASTGSTDAASNTVSTGDSTVKGLPFETVDELMLIPGMTRDLLYGPAATRNSTTDTTSDWYLTHGVFDYFTVWSTQPNTAADGTKRISFISDEQRTDLSNLLTDKLGNQTRSSEILRSITETTGTGRNRRPAPMQLSGMFDFADHASLTPDEFSSIEDYVTRDSQATSLVGLVNINQAPRDVLRALGKLSDSDVDTLIAARVDASTQSPNSTAWVRTAINTNAVALDGYVTGQGRQYSADIIAASGNGRGWKRVRVVVDTTSTPARIVYRRDLTDQGWPLDPAILDQLKAGTFVGGTASTGTVSGGTAAAGAR